MKNKKRKNDNLTSGDGAENEVISVSDYTARMNYKHCMCIIKDAMFLSNEREFAGVYAMLFGIRQCVETIGAIYHLSDKEEAKGG